MKTLTEFSTLMLRKAAAARATVPTAHASARHNEPSVADATDQPAAVEPTPDPAAEAGAEAEIEAASEPAADAAVDAAVDAAQASTPEDEGSRDPMSDPAVAAVAAACGVQPDRAARLLEALDIINPDAPGAIDRVRLVRVYQGEKGPHNAVSRGEFHYVVDKVAAPARDRRNGKSGHGAHSGRDSRERPGGGGGGGGTGGSFRGSDRKPRGLGSLKYGAAPEPKDPSDERPGRGEMPRAGVGWQLTPSPRTAEDFARGPGRRRPPAGRKPRGTRGGPHGRAADRGPSNPDSFQRVRPSGAPEAPPQVRADGQPTPPRKKRPRKPLGPDANGLGPDGTPWDPERRAKRMAERADKVNEVQQSSVPGPAEAPPPPMSSEDSK